MNLIYLIFIAALTSAATHEPVQPDANGVYAYKGEYPALIHKSDIWCE